MLQCSSVSGGTALIFLWILPSCYFPLSLSTAEYGLQRIAFWSIYLHNQIRMCDCQWTPPSEGAPEERGCCPAQQWRDSPPLSPSKLACTCIAPTHPGCSSAIRRSTLGGNDLQAVEGDGERNTAREGSECVMGVGGQGWAELFKHAECELALRG